MFGFAFCLGVMLGLIIAVMEWFVWSYIFKKEKDAHDDLMFVQSCKIEQLREDLEIMIRRNHKTAQIAKTANKIKQFPQRDESWSVDIPITHTACK